MRRRSFGAVYAPDTTGGDSWVDRAACLGHDNPDLWHPDSGDPADAAEAIGICMGCPVVSACLNAALAEEGGRGMASRHGIRGGLTDRQRHRMYAAAAKRKRARGDVA